MRTGLAAVLAGGLAAASLAVVASLGVASISLDLRPDGPGWPRLVRGAPGGRIGRMVAVLPGLDRSSERQLRIETQAPADLAVVLEGARRELRVGRDGAILELPTSGVPGAQIEIAPASVGSDVVLTRLAVDAAPLGALRAVLSGTLVGLTALGLCLRFGLRLGGALSLVAASAAALVQAPALLWLTLPAPASAARLLGALAPACAALAVVRSGERPAFARGTGLLACAALGLGVRLFFLPAAGSWDTDYWKANAERVRSAGFANVYGGPDAVPPGALTAQLRGAPRFAIAFRGHEYTVDYPPLAIASWAGAARLLDALHVLAPAERENAAAKLPPVLGDVLAVVALLYVLRARPRAAAWLAALYWALPVSWLSSAVLGYFDGTLVAFVLLAVAAAGEGHAGRAGALLGLAAVFKPTALLVAPAMAVALLARGGSLRRAAGSALAVAALAFVPFAAAGTLTTALVHVRGMFFQERLSGGFANGWWILGHLLDGSSWGAAVRFVPLGAAHFPANAIGVLLFVASAVLILRRQLRRPGGGPAFVAGAALVYAYAMLAIGVHENHPHLAVACLLASGLKSRRLRLLAAAFGSIYVLNMLALGGLGRLYGLRYAALEPLAQDILTARLALGFDVTLLLAAVNLLLFAWTLARIDRLLADAAEPVPAGYNAGGTGGLA
jgi:hypothetical protein